MNALTHAIARARPARTTTVLVGLAISVAVSASCPALAAATVPRCASKPISVPDGFVEHVRQTATTRSPHHRPVTTTTEEWISSDRVHVVATYAGERSDEYESLDTLHDAVSWSKSSNTLTESRFIPTNPSFGCGGTIEDEVAGVRRRLRRGILRVAGHVERDGRALLILRTVTRLRDRDRSRRLRFRETLLVDAESLQIVKMTTWLGPDRVTVVFSVKETIDAADVPARSLEMRPHPHAKRRARTFHLEGSR